MQKKNPNENSKYFSLYEFILTGRCEISLVANQVDKIFRASVKPQMTQNGAKSGLQIACKTPVAHFVRDAGLIVGVDQMRSRRTC